MKELRIFESIHHVKCLFCEDKFECEDPKNEKIINQCIKKIDEDLHSLEKHPDSKTRTRLLKGREKLKARIKKFVSADSSHLFFIGKKQHPWKAIHSVAKNM